MQPADSTQVGLPTASAIAFNGTPSTTSPSMACMDRCGRAEINSAKSGSGSWTAARDAGMEGY